MPVANKIHKLNQPNKIKILEREIAVEALRAYAFKIMLPNSDYSNEAVERFERNFNVSYEKIIAEIREKLPTRDKRTFKNPENAEIIYKDYLIIVSPHVQYEKEPTQILIDEKKQWVYKGYVYEVDDYYNEDEIKLLILEEFDKERRYFEKLKAKFNPTDEPLSFKRIRIQENIRIEVWRRDSGKCARCGSRERLEYDHIVPISKGGSNTARNIELLCEKCNRSKSNNVV
jgi:hypothetical protein